jgi:hypothetical protein
VYGTHSEIRVLYTGRVDRERWNVGGHNNDKQASVKNLENDGANKQGNLLRVRRRMHFKLAQAVQDVPHRYIYEHGKGRGSANYPRVR